jgi:transposase
MKEVAISGLDLAKNTFQAHATYLHGGVAFRRKLSRGKVLSSLSAQPPCIVALDQHIPQENVIAVTMVFV